uniref:Fe2OG dioxygenase domain-containing protein n=1 Tax=Lotharella globosa TaxID=91324 RepID=A0A7S3ZBX5_9EUKA|mmetsp:Transcript_5839/g.11575  ORF Transcript_5839/g.11575 Transcript_5839/m.11575 type:complete len:341 (-) Transcript_5839:197-1219(-)
MSFEQLTDEERKMIKDIEPHLPDHIRSLPKEKQREVLIGHIMKVREQSNSEALYFKSLEAYKAKDTNLYDLKNWVFDKRFIEILANAKADQGRKRSPEDSKGALNGVEEVSPGVFRFPMLDVKFAGRLIDEVDYFQKWSEENGVHVHRPNSMNNYGAILDHFGFRPVLQNLMKWAIDPLTTRFFPHVGRLDGDHHGFMVSYQKGKDTKLDFHRDDSEVTLNLCMGRKFKGGDLYFGGVRCLKHQQVPPTKEEEVTVGHEAGYALLHLGAHRHAAKHIEDGHRENLILWCRSETYRKRSTDQRCNPWCGCHAPTVAAPCGTNNPQTSTTDPGDEKRDKRVS